MAVADNVPRIDALILEGMTAKAAFQQVAEETGISKASLTTAYYRTKRKLGIKMRSSGPRKGRSRRATREPLPAPQASATNGKIVGVSIEDLLQQLRRNRLEHDAIMDALEAQVAVHTTKLEEVRAALAAP